MITQNYDIVAVPTASFIYDFVAKYPNVTLWGINFNLASQNMQYQIWYNFSQTTLNGDPWGPSILSLRRGIDEAISQ